MPKIVNHDEYREELVWSCFSTFADKGYARCTIKELAAGAGVTSGTLYHYFENKRTLFESVVRTMAEADLDSLEETLESIEGTRERLRALGCYLDVHEEYLARQNRIWTELVQMDDFEREKIEDLYQRYRALLRSVISPESFNLQTQEHVVTMLAAVVDGLIFHRQFDKDQDDFEKLFLTLADLLSPPEAKQ